jgi:carboxypeptidase Q
MSLFRPARTRIAVVAALAYALPLGAQSATAARPEAVDTAAIAKIVREATERSQVMELASWMTDVHGSRLTGTPQLKAAGEWARSTLARWGLANAALEPFTVPGFDRGWTNERFSMQVVAPTKYPVIATPSAWTAGTNGPVTADVVYAPITDTTQLAQWAGKLRGKLVMSAPPRALEPHWKAEASRLDDEALSRMSAWASPADRGPRDTSEMARRRQAMQQQMAVRNRVAKFLVDEGAIGVLTEARGDGGTVFNNNGGSKDSKQPVSAMQLMVSAEHYGRIARTLQKGVPVTVELDVKNSFFDATPNMFNVVAEIPGTDPKLKGEVVMLGAHYDAWHTATGATDNAAGSAVMMEAVRILKTLGLPMKRTVRIALWTGEEQGLHGSRQYVAKHFADRQTGAKTPEWEKLSAYFNVDNGSGKIRGIYAENNRDAAKLFEAWMAPFRTMGTTTVTLAPTGGTDHMAFDAVGLPGFQFIQDGLEYGTRTHHSNMDTYERLVPDDMKHNAAVVASFVYQAANRGEKVPRKAAPVTAASR